MGVFEIEKQLLERNKSDPQAQEVFLTYLFIWKLDRGLIIDSYKHFNLIPQRKLNKIS